jgi:hypothetical protein
MESDRLFLGQDKHIAQGIHDFVPLIFSWGQISRMPRIYKVD